MIHQCKPYSESVLSSVCQSHDYIFSSFCVIFMTRDFTRIIERKCPSFFCWKVVPFLYEFKFTIIIWRFKRSVEICHFYVFIQYHWSVYAKHIIGILVIFNISIFAKGFFLFCSKLARKGDRPTDSEKRCILLLNLYVKKHWLNTFL